MLACAGVAFWCVVGLPWGPHNESFDWIVRLETRSFWAALFEPFPSVLSARPLGTGAAWLLYRLGGHDIALTQVVNALCTLFAWAVAARAARERRLFALLALVSGGVFFAPYIYLFHLHGIFYGPLLLFTASLLAAARGPLDLRTLLGVFLGGLLASLVHPYALPLVVAFAIGTAIEAPLLRSRAGVAALAVVLTGTFAAYRLLVPADGSGIADTHLAGLLASYRTAEVNAVGSTIAALLAAWTAARAVPGPAGGIAALLTLALAVAARVTGLPVLPLWIMWTIAKSLRHGRWALAAVLGASALLPLPNPTGSPTYTVFALFAATHATAVDEPGNEGLLHGLRARHVGVLVSALLVLALLARFGAPVPVLQGLARPLLAEGERTRQLVVLADSLLASPERSAPVSLLHEAENPAEGGALDRRFRAPTNSNHLVTWMDWRRGGPATGADTLWLVFGGESVPGMDTVRVVRGRWAGDALLLRRLPAASQ